MIPLTQANEEIFACENKRLVGAAVGPANGTYMEIFPNARENV